MVVSLAEGLGSLLVRSEFSVREDCSSLVFGAVAVANVSADATAGLASLLASYAT